jgi:O-antigen/teichoic acid export membrane protein
MLVRQSAVYAFGAIALAVIALVMIAVYSRLFTAEQYGTYAIVMSSAALAYGTTLNWLSTTIIRMYAATEDKRGFLGAVLYYYLLVAAVAVAGSLASFIWLQSGEERTLVLVGLCVFLAIGWMELQFRIYQARLEAARLTRARLFRSSLAAVVGASLAWTGWGPIGALIGALAGALLPALIEIITVWRHVPIGGTVAIRDSLWKFGSPLIASFALGQVSRFSGRYLVIWLEGIAMMGIYSLALELAARLANTLLMPINSAAAPLAVDRVERNNHAAARAGLHNAFVLFVGISIPSVTGISFVAGDLAAVFIGEQFQAGVVVLLPLLVLSFFITGLTNSYLDLSLHLSLNSKKILYRSIAGSILNLVLGFLLIRSYGLVGAAYASLITALLMGALTWWLGKDAFRLPIPWRPLLKVIVANAAMAAVLLLIQFEPGLVGLAVKVAAGVAVYGAALLLLDLEGIRSRLPGWLKQLQKKLGLSLVPEAPSPTDQKLS